MSRSTRRDFLGTTGAALAANSLPSFTPVNEAGKLAAENVCALPPQRALPLEGVHAYTDQVSVAAGETIRFHVSSTDPYELQVCRLGVDVDDPASDEVLHSFKNAKPVVQPIHPGSYLHVDK